MIDLNVLKLVRNYLTNCESKFKGTSNQDVPFFVSCPGATGRIAYSRLKSLSLF